MGCVGDDAEVPDPGSAGRGRKGVQELQGAHPELGPDDRFVDRDDHGIWLQPNQATAPDGRRDAFRDERVPGGDRPREPKLGLEAKAARGVREQIAQTVGFPPAPLVAHAGASSREIPAALTVTAQAVPLERSV
jgi:hypothetical protein